MAGQDDLRNDMVNEVVSSPSSSFLIRLAEGDSLLTGLYLLQALVTGKGQKGIYISCNANSPYHFLEYYFGAHGVDTSKVLFIDTVSMPMLGRKAVDRENVYFTQANVAKDAMAVLRELVNGDGLSFVYFDSLTEMLKFHGEAEIRGFLSELIGLIKQRQMTGVILSFYSAREASFVQSIVQYCDRCIDL